MSPLRERARLLLDAIEAERVAGSAGDGSAWLTWHDGGEERALLAVERALTAGMGSEGSRQSAALRLPPELLRLWRLGAQVSHAHALGSNLAAEALLKLLDEVERVYGELDALLVLVDLAKLTNVAFPTADRLVKGI